MYQFNKNAKIDVPFSWYSVISTWFYIGMIRLMPGTFGSLATFPLYYILLCYSVDLAEFEFYCQIILVPIFLLGWLAIHEFQKNIRIYDHSSIVIDEVIGMLVVMAIAFQDAYNLMLALYPWLNIAPSNGAFFLIFGLFRFFDIKKPFFIKKLDRMSKSSIFVILDDIFAALFASGVIKIAFLIIDRIL